MEEQAVHGHGGTAIGELFPAQTDVPGCFACGRGNPSGLGLRFRREGEASVSTRFTPPGDWTGWGSVLHGGFHALLLDEVTAWVPFGLWDERAFVTREMHVRFVRPAFVGRPLFIVGSLVEDQGREIVVRGEIRDERGNVLTEARCILVRLSKEAMEGIAAPG